MDAQFITRDFLAAPGGGPFARRMAAVRCGLLAAVLLVFGWTAILHGGFVIAGWRAPLLACDGQVALAVAIVVFQLAGQFGLRFAKLVGWGMGAAATLLAACVVTPLLWLLANRAG